MDVPNLTMDMGTVVGWTNTTMKDVCFTSFEWVKFVDAVNQSNETALRAGLVIGAIAGTLGFALAMKYMEYRKEKDWEKYGKD